MMVNLSAAYDCIRAFSETDLTEDLKRITVPMLLNHGDDDQIVPVHDASRKAVELVPNGTLRIYPGAPHGIHGDYRKELDQDMLDWLKN
jgi:non-heme chloroperoxidase